MGCTRWRVATAGERAHLFRYAAPPHLPKAVAAACDERLTDNVKADRAARGPPDTINQAWWPSVPAWVGANTRGRTRERTPYHWQSLSAAKVPSWLSDRIDDAAPAVALAVSVGGAGGGGTRGPGRLAPSSALPMLGRVPFLDSRREDVAVAPSGRLACVSNGAVLAVFGGSAARSSPVSARAKLERVARPTRPCSLAAVPPRPRSGAQVYRRRPGCSAPYQRGCRWLGAARPAPSRGRWLPGSPRWSWAPPCHVETRAARRCRWPECCASATGLGCRLRCRALPSS